MKWLTRCLAVLAVVVASATVTNPLWAKKPIYSAGILVGPNTCACGVRVGDCMCIWIEPEP